MHITPEPPELSIELTGVSAKPPAQVVPTSTVDVASGGAAHEREPKPVFVDLDDPVAVRDLALAGFARRSSDRSVTAWCQDGGMAYDEDLANRVRELIGRQPGIDEKRMFGGLAMMLNGNMAVVIRGAGGLMVRVDPARSEQLLTERGAQPTQMRGRTMRGWITVEPSACVKDVDLRRWVNRGVTFARGLPAK
jgi:TfoX/Sxy family transcriptional regulator of competence genes